MSFEQEFLTMMKDEVSVQHWDGVSRDEQGDPTGHAAAIPYRCRIAGKAMALRRPNEEQEVIIYDCWIYNHDSARFRQEDLITVPANYAFLQKEPQIFTVGTFGDEDDQHHVKVQFGWQYHRQGQ